MQRLRGDCSFHSKLFAALYGFSGDSCGSQIYRRRPGKLAESYLRNFFCTCNIFFHDSDNFKRGLRYMQGFLFTTLFCVRIKKREAIPFGGPPSLYTKQKFYLKL
jgi:hypothetical protein